MTAPALSGKDILQNYGYRSPVSVFWVDDDRDRASDTYSTFCEVEQAEQRLLEMKNRVKQYRNMGDVNVARYVENVALPNLEAEILHGKNKLEELLRSI